MSFATWVRNPQPLHNRVHMEVDGVPLNLHGMQGVIVTNLASYAGGVNLWGEHNEADTHVDEPRIDDFKFEVLGVKSMVDFGVFQAAARSGLSRLGAPQRLAQGSALEIRWLSGEHHIPVQNDGEPWMQRPCTIKISVMNQGSVLLNRNKQKEES